MVHVPFFLQASICLFWIEYIPPLFNGVCTPFFGDSFIGEPCIHFLGVYSTFCVAEHIPHFWDEVYIYLIFCGGVYSIFHDRVYTTFICDGVYTIILQ
jgi:hypothetical protein